MATAPCTKYFIAASSARGVRADSDERVAGERDELEAMTNTTRS